MPANCFDYSYPQIIYSLVLQRTTQVSEMIDEAVLKLLSKLFELCDYISVANFLKDDAWSIENVNISMIVLRPLLKENIRRYYWHRRTMTGCSGHVNLYRANEYWKRLLDLILDSLSKELERAEKIHIIPNFVNIFKTVFAVSSLVSNITEGLESENIEVKFFGEKIGTIVDALIKLFEGDSSKTTLFFFLKFARNISSLREVANYDQRTRQRFSALFTLSWLPQMSFDNALPESFREKCLSYVDDEIREFCIISLMTNVHRYEFVNWRDHFFREIIARRSAKKLENLPILVHSLDDNDFAALIDDIHRTPGKETLNELSSHIRLLVCGADTEHSFIVRSNDTYHLSCNLCGSGTISKVSTASRCALLDKLVIRMFGGCEEAQYNVLCAVVYLFRHLPKTITLLEALKTAFRSSNTDVYKKFIEVIPHLIFRPPDENANPFLPPTTSKFCLANFKDFMNYLREAVFRALINQDIQVQYVCVNAVAQISCNPFSTYDTLLPCIDLLLHFMLNASSVYALLAKSSMRQIAIHHNFLTEEDIYKRYREEVSRRVADILVFNFRTYGITLTNLNRVYGNVVNGSTISHILKYLMPHIAKEKKLAVLLPELADLLPKPQEKSEEKPVVKMLLTAVKHIISHVMLFEVEILKTVLVLVCQETGIPKIFQLLSKYVTRVSEFLEVARGNRDT